MIRTITISISRAETAKVEKAPKEKYKRAKVIGDMPRANAPKPRMIPRFFPCSKGDEKRDASEESPGFKKALPREITPRERMVRPKLFEKLNTSNPINKDTAPKRAIFFSATFPEIRRITPPWTNMIIVPK